MLRTSWNPPPPSTSLCSYSQTAIASCPGLGSPFSLAPRSSPWLLSLLPSCVPEGSCHLSQIASLLCSEPSVTPILFGVGTIDLTVSHKPEHPTTTTLSPHLLPLSSLTQPQLPATTPPETTQAQPTPGPWYLLSPNSHSLGTGEQCSEQGPWRQRGFRSQPCACASWGAFFTFVSHM